MRRPGKPATAGGVGVSVSSPVPVPAPPNSRDFGVPWHYGDPHSEQRLLSSGRGAVDLGHRDVLTVGGADRRKWLHDLTTAHLRDLQPGGSAQALILSPHGHVEHDLHVCDDGEQIWISAEPGTGTALARYLDSMRFMLDVWIAPRPDVAVVWVSGQEWPELPALARWTLPADYQGIGVTPAGPADAAAKYVPARPGYLVGGEMLVPRDAVAELLSARGAAGTWALEALRVAAAIPRLGMETDHRTIPAEVGWIGPAVHLAKGCYRGQETVARVHNLGRPPRRLALAHLDGSAGPFPMHGDAVLVAGQQVGWVGTAARHYELGPLATVILKRNTPVDAEMTVLTAQGPVVASQQVVVIP